MTPSRRLLAWVIAIGVGAAIAIAFVPGRRFSIIAAAAMLLLARSLTAIVTATRGLAPAEPDAYRRALAVTPPTVARPPDLQQLERVLGWGSYRPADFDYQVRPVLLDLVAFRLRLPRGSNIELDPRVGERLPADLRRLLRGLGGDAEPIRTEEIERLVAAIELL